MLAAIFLLAFLGNSASVSLVPMQYVDVLEVNHVHSTDGKPLFTQVLYRRWSAEYRRHDIHDYSIVYDVMDLPIEKAGGYEVRFRDNMDLRRTCIVRADICIETKTLGDPERLECKVFPSAARKRIMPGGGGMYMPTVPGVSIVEPR